MHSCSTTTDSYECHELRYTHCLTLLKSAPCTMQQAGYHRASKIVPQEPRRLKEARINIGGERLCRHIGAGAARLQSENRSGLAEVRLTHA